MRACQPKDAKNESGGAGQRVGGGVVGRGEKEREKEHTHVEGGEREREKALWLLLLYVFSSPWACPMQIGLSQECCLFYLRSSLRSSDLPLFYFRRLFPSLSFSHCHFEILFPILNYPTLLDNIVLVLPYIDMNPPWVYMCSPSRTPLPPLSPSHPSGSSQCTSP